MIKLVCKNVKFYSPLDKDFFFERVQGISAIKQVAVKNRDIFLSLKSKRVSYNDLSKIVSLFDRYKINRDQLAVFLNDTNKDWLVYYLRGICRFRRGKFRFPPDYGVTRYLNHIVVAGIHEGLSKQKLLIS